MQRTGLQPDLMVLVTALVFQASVGKCEGVWEIWISGIAFGQSAIQPDLREKSEVEPKLPPALFSNATNIPFKDMPLYPASFSHTLFLWQEKSEVEPKLPPALFSNVTNIPFKDMPL